MRHLSRNALIALIINLVLAVGSARAQVQFQHIVIHRPGKPDSRQFVGSNPTFEPGLTFKPMASTRKVRSCHLPRTARGLL